MAPSFECIMIPYGDPRSAISARHFSKRHAYPHTWSQVLTSFFLGISYAAKPRDCEAVTGHYLSWTLAQHDPKPNLSLRRCCLHLNSSYHHYDVAPGLATLSRFFQRKGEKITIKEKSTFPKSIKRKRALQKSIYRDV